MTWEICFFDSFTICKKKIEKWTFIKEMLDCCINQIVHKILQDAIWRLRTVQGNSFPKCISSRKLDDRCCTFLHCKMFKNKYIYRWEVWNTIAIQYELLRMKMWTLFRFFLNYIYSLTNSVKSIVFYVWVRQFMSIDCQIITTPLGKWMEIQIEVLLCGIWANFWK